MTIPTLSPGTLITTPEGEIAYIDRILSPTYRMIRLKHTETYIAYHVDHILPYEGEYIPGSATEPPEYWDNEDDEVPF